MIRRVTQRLDLIKTSVNAVSFYFNDDDDHNNGCEENKSVTIVEMLIMSLQTTLMEIVIMWK